MSERPDEPIWSIPDAPLYIGVTLILIFIIGAYQSPNVGYAMGYGIIPAALSIAFYYATATISNRKYARLLYAGLVLLMLYWFYFPRIHWFGNFIEMFR